MQAKPMRPRRRFVAALAVAGLLLASGAKAGTPSVAGPTVTVDNFSFSPETITVPAGSTVTWTNRDDIPHTVTSADDPKAFKSPPLDTDDKFSVAFAKPGIYRYFCSLHPHMQGTVMVQ